MRGALWACELSPLVAPRERRDEYAVRQVHRGPMAERLALAMGAEEAVVRDRLQRGCRAYAAWAEGAAVSWLWVSTGEEYAPPLRRTLQIPEGDCYGWDAGTLEAHRGRRLCTSVLEYAGWRMAQAGMRAMWNGILDENVASQRAHARAGFLPVLFLATDPASPEVVNWPASYADPRLVERARLLLGAAWTRHLPPAPCRAGLKGERP